MFHPARDRYDSFVASLLCGLVVAFLGLATFANSQDALLREAMQKYIMALTANPPTNSK